MEWQSFTERRGHNFAKAWRFVWDTITGNMVFYLAVMLILLVPLNLIYCLQRLLAPGDLGFYIPVVLFSFLLTMIIHAIFIQIGLRFAAHERAGLSDIKVAIRLSWRYFLGLIMYVLIVLGGLVLLIIPGLVFSFKYQFFGYFIIDLGMKPREALTRSGQITQGEKGHLYLFYLVSVLISCLFVGPLYYFVSKASAQIFISVAYSLYLIALAYIYRRLLATEGEGLNLDTPGQPIESLSESPEGVISSPGDERQDARQPDDMS